VAGLSPALLKLIQDAQRIAAEATKREAERAPATEPQFVPPPADGSELVAQWAAPAAPSVDLEETSTPAPPPVERLKIGKSAADIEALEEAEAEHESQRLAKLQTQVFEIDTLAPAGRPSVVIQIPAPRELQVPILDHPARFKGIRAGRRVGKTRLEFIAAIRGHGPLVEIDRGFDEHGVKRAPLIRRKWKGIAHGADIVWIAPDYGQADAIWEEEILPRFEGKAGVTISEKHKLVGFGRFLGKDRKGEPVYQGSLRLRSAENINSVRGKKFDGVIVDEAAFLKFFHAWRRVLRPTLIDRKGWAIIASTTDIGSDFNALIVSIEKKQRGPSWHSWHLRTFDNPYIDEEERRELQLEYVAGSAEEQQELGADLLETLGTLFRKEFIHRYSAATREAVWIGNLRYAFQYLVMTADLASSMKQTADFTAFTIAGVCWPVDGLQRTVILEVVNERLEGPAQIDRMEALINRWRPAYIDIENTQYQQTAVQHLEVRLRGRGFNVRGVPSSKDKYTRAVPAAGAMSRAEWYFPPDHNPLTGTGAPWMPDVTAQLLKFPNGKDDSKFVEDHDDIVDTLSLLAARVGGGLNTAWKTHKVQTR
jgi:predicted phage terminase large subunit-like protein